MDIKPIHAISSSLEKSTPYFAMRSAFRDLFEMDNAENLEELESKIETILNQDASWRDRAPLLNVILPFAFPETDLTRQLSGEVRANTTQKLIVDLLNYFGANRKMVLVIEDAQWLDSASWMVLKVIYEDVPSLFLILETRPIQKNRVPEFE
jgi:predicted ATPase